MYLNKSRPVNEKLSQVPKRKCRQLFFCNWVEPVNLQDGGTAALCYWYTRVSRLCCGLLGCSLSAGIFALCIPAFSLWFFSPIFRNPLQHLREVFIVVLEIPHGYRSTSLLQNALLKKITRSNMFGKRGRLELRFWMFTLCSKVLKTWKNPI